MFWKHTCVCIVAKEYFVFDVKATHYWHFMFQNVRESCSIVHVIRCTDALNLLLISANLILC